MPSRINTSTGSSLDGSLDRAGWTLVDSSPTLVDPASQLNTQARPTIDFNPPLCGQFFRFYFPSTFCPGTDALGGQDRPSYCAHTQDITAFAEMLLFGTEGPPPPPPPTTISPTTTAPTTNAPVTTAPSGIPTSAPTRHACNDGTHGCDSTPFGSCEQLPATVLGYRCGCAASHQCSDGGCTAPGHTCDLITINPTATPTASAPTAAPTDAPVTPAPTPAPTGPPTLAPLLSELEIDLIERTLYRSRAVYDVEFLRGSLEDDLRAHGLATFTYNGLAVVLTRNGGADGGVTAVVNGGSPVITAGVLTLSGGAVCGYSARGSNDCVMVTEAPAPGPTNTPTQAPMPAPDNAAGGSTGSGAGSDGGGNATAVVVVIAVAFIVIVGIVLGAVIYVKKVVAGGGNRASSPGSFENPLYGAAGAGDRTGVGAGAGAGYMDVPVSRNPEYAAGAGENGGVQHAGGFGQDSATGYMDVAVAAGVGGDSDDAEDV